MTNETLTCPRGSLRNGDKVPSDLSWSKVDICETHLLVTTVCHSDGGKRDIKNKELAMFSFDDRREPT